MPNTTERETAEKTYRAQQAAIVAGLQTILDRDEQMLAFARGRISGGWRGKLAVGPEAFFAPGVNVGLTERRFVLQHIHATSGTPSEILPHSFPLADIAALTFSDIETFGGEPSGRIILRLQDEQHFRVKVAGKQNCEDARALSAVFQSLTTARRKTGASPTQSVCPACQHILDQATRFCPYCGHRFDTAAAPETAAPTEPITVVAEVSEPPMPPDSGFDVPAAPEPPVPPISEFVETPPAPTAEALETIATETPESEAVPANAYVVDEPIEPELPALIENTPPAPYPAASQTLDVEIVPDSDALKPLAEDADTYTMETRNPAEPAENSPDVPPSPIGPAPSAFWAEFARLSGVVAPEASASESHSETHPSKSENEKGSTAPQGDYYI